MYLSGLAGDAGTVPTGPSRGVVRKIAVHERMLAERFLQGIADLPEVSGGIVDPARLEERTPTFAIRVGDELPGQTANAWPNAASSCGTATTTRERS